MTLAAGQRARHCATGVLLLQKVAARAGKKSRGAVGEAAVRVLVISIMASEMHAFADFDASLVVKREANIFRALNNDASFERRES